MNIRDYKESIRKRPRVNQWVAHIEYIQEQDGVDTKVEHYIHSINREALMVKVQEYKQQIGLV